jgi:hypothetical protein
MQKVIISFGIVCLFALHVRADNRTLAGCEYWIDDGGSNFINVGGGSIIQFSVDASVLKEGLHTLYYRAKDSEGIYSPLFSWIFYRFVNEQADGNKLEYWIDGGEHLTRNISRAEVTFVLDASAVEEGLHTLHYRPMTLSGQTGSESTWLFYRVAPDYKGGNRTLEYWIDEGEHLTRGVNDADITFMLDASTIGEGLHSFNYLLKDEGGHMSPLQSWKFYKVGEKANKISWCRFWWNNYHEQYIDKQLTDGSAIYLYEDILTVPEYARNDGFSRNNTARLNIVFGDNLGRISQIETAMVEYPDIYPPVTTLKVTKDGDSAKLTWEANEDGVRDYNVYYSENGEPYVLWKPNIVQQEATFRGQKGSTYRFMVTARDVKGNYEAMEVSKTVEVEFK